MQDVQFERHSLPTLFSAVQMHPRTVLDFTWCGLGQWLETRGISFPSLISEHKTGFVALGCELNYASSPTGFFDAGNHITVKTEACMRRNRSRVGLHVQVVTETAQGVRPIADVSMLLVPVAIADLESWAAEPCLVPDALASCFAPDEDLDDKPKRSLPAAIHELRSSGAPIATGELAITLNRFRCEAADQWMFLDIPTYTEASRESLVWKHRGEHEALSSALASSSASVAFELSRPFYAFDEMTVATEAFLVNDRLAFVHELRSKVGSHGTIVEKF